MIESFILFRKEDVVAIVIVVLGIYVDILSVECDFSCRCYDNGKGDDENQEND